MVISGVGYFVYWRHEMSDFEVGCYLKDKKDSKLFIIGRYIAPDLYYLVDATRRDPNVLKIYTLKQLKRDYQIDKSAYILYGDKVI